MSQVKLYKRINLIPQEFKIQQRYDLKKTLSACIFISLIAIGLIYLYQITSIQRYKTKIATYQMLKGELLKEKTRLENILLDFNNVSGKEKGIEKIAKVAGEIDKNRIVWSEILKRLTHLFPSTLWLNQLYVMDEELKVKGSQKPQTVKKMVLKGSSLTQEGVTEILTNLERSELFSHVILEYGEKKRTGNEGIFDFQIKVQLKRKN
jgi:Tfp pilus assembly protein PilN